MGTTGKVLLLLGAIVVMGVAIMAVAMYPRYQEYQSRKVIGELLPQFTELKINFAEYVIVEQAAPDPGTVDQWIEDTTDLAGVRYDPQGFIEIDLAAATEGAVESGSLFLVPQAEGYNVRFACGARGIAPEMVPFSCR